MTAAAKVLVIGGGIGGLAAARAIRLKGIAVDLIEIESDWTVYGVGICQPINALRALDTIGLAQRCIERGAPFNGWRVCDANGRIFIDAPGRQHDGEKLPNLNGITRPVLHSILISGANEVGVHIRLGVAVAKLVQYDSEVEVSFTDNTTGRYDLVVGFDGTRSETRKFLFGDAYQPSFTGQGTWRYNLPRPPEIDTGMLFYGEGTKVGLCPLAKDKMYLFVVTAETDGTWYSGAGLANEMRSRIAGYGEMISCLRKQIVDPGEVVYRPMLVSLIEEPWYKGRVMVAGDAAHATTPHLAQGAAMAIEDGVVLAEVLSQSDDLDVALSAFMRRRYDRSKYVVDCSIKIGTWEMESWRGDHTNAPRLGPLLHEATVKLAN